MQKKMKSQSKSKTKRLIPFRDSNRSDPLESSLLSEDIDEEEVQEEEEIEVTDQNDDESVKNDNTFEDIEQNIELPQIKSKKRVVMVLFKVENDCFLASNYGFKGYTYDEQHFYKRDVYSNMLKMTNAIQNYANGFFPFEIDTLSPQNFFERFKSDMLLSKIEKNKGDKNATNRHFLKYYIRFWNGVDVKLSSLTFSGRPNDEILAMTIFRIGIGSSKEIKEKFKGIDPKRVKNNKLEETNDVLHVMNDIFKAGNNESGLRSDKFLELLNKNDEFMKIVERVIEK